jgi:hypothetical protein
MWAVDIGAHAARAGTLDALPRLIVWHADCGHCSFANAKEVNDGNV